MSSRWLVSTFLRDSQRRMSPQGAAHMEGEAANRFVMLVGRPASPLVLLVFGALFGKLVGDDT